MTPLESLVASGTKLWLDSVDPAEVDRNLGFGATGATSNPIIIADLIKTGRFDDNDGPVHGRIGGRRGHRLGDDRPAGAARPRRCSCRSGRRRRATTATSASSSTRCSKTRRNTLSVPDKAKRYIELGKKWSAGHKNRMIKVPATPGGLAALEELAAAGVTLNVTLIFTERQYKIARDAIWRGAQRRQSLDGFKSVYSIFVSRVDVYTEKHVPELSPAAQGMVGIVNAKRIWQLNQRVLGRQELPLKQEMIFASTGTKKQGRSAVEVRRGVRRHRHRDQPAGDQRGRAGERPDVHAAGRSDAAGRRAGRDRREGGHAEAGRDADGRRAREVRRPAEGAA